MIANYYTLLHIARDLDRELRGAALVEVFSQNKQELVIHAKDEEKEFFLTVGCEPLRNFIGLRNVFARAKKNSVDFFDAVIGTTILNVSIHPNDRQISLLMQTSDRIVIQLFASKANVFLVDSTDRVVESFLKSEDRIGKPLQERATTHDEPDTAESFERKLASVADTPLKPALKKVFPKLGGDLVEELLMRSGLSAGLLPGGLAESEKRRLLETSKSLLAELTGPVSPRIYFKETAPGIFSVIPLKHLQHLNVETFESIHDAVRVAMRAVQQDTLFTGKKEPILHALDREIERAERALGKIAQEAGSYDRAEQFETMGKLLMANLHTLKKGMKGVQLENVFVHPVVSLEIRLDPSLTPARNAERYFEKAKKVRGAIKEQKERSGQLAVRVHVARSLSEELGRISSEELLQDYLAAHAAQLKDLGIKLDKRGGQKKQEHVPFRVFAVAGGFQVWAGKSSADNDVLTLKHAKPNDLWFHARGSSGSHVVLKVDTANGEPSKQAIEQAASIAAHYSKMKKSKFVPVIMTERKYVRKPKGSPPGTVRVEREKLLFVEPKLPSGEMD